MGSSFTEIPSLYWLYIDCNPFGSSEGSQRREEESHYGKGGEFDHHQLNEIWMKTMMLNLACDELLHQQTVFFSVSSPSYS